MRRVIAYGRTKAKWRTGKADEHIPLALDPAVQEGIRAYAFEHADHESALANHLENKWAAIRLRASAVLNGELGSSSLEVELEEEGEMPEGDDEGDGHHADHD